MDGDTGVQKLVDFWKWTEDVFGEEFCDQRDQGEDFSLSPPVCSSGVYHFHRGV